MQRLNPRRKKAAIRYRLSSLIAYILALPYSDYLLILLITPVTANSMNSTSKIKVRTTIYQLFSKVSGAAKPRISSTKAKSGNNIDKEILKPSLNVEEAIEYIISEFAIITTLFTPTLKKE